MTKLLRTRGYNTFIENKYCIRNVELIQIIIWISYIQRHFFAYEQLASFQGRSIVNEYKWKLYALPGDTFVSGGSVLYIC